MSHIHADRTPIDRTAANMTAKGVKSPMPKSDDRHFRAHAPPKIYRKIPYMLRKQGSWTDLTGVEFGRFTVIGLMLSNSTRWVVRCSCGFHEVKRAKAIKNEGNSQDMCGVCRNLEYLKKGQSL